VARTPIGDQLVSALEAISELQGTMRKHDELLAQIINQISDLNKRMKVTEEGGDDSGRE
jgi:hypothetical protein